MTAVPAPKPAIPQWLMDAVVGLVTSAYEAGRAEAAVPVEQKPDNYTLAEAAQLLRVSMNTINALVNGDEPRLASFTVGRRRFVTAEALETYRKRT